MTHIVTTDKNDLIAHIIDILESDIVDPSGASILDVFLSQFSLDRETTDVFVSALNEVIQKIVHSQESSWIGFLALIRELNIYNVSLSDALVELTQKCLPRDAAARAWAHHARLQLRRPATITELEMDEELILSKAGLAYDVVLVTSTPAGAIEAGSRWIENGWLTSDDIIGRLEKIEVLMGEIDNSTGRTYFVDACRQFVSAMRTEVERDRLATTVDRVFGVGLQEYYVDYSRPMRGRVPYEIDWLKASPGSHSPQKGTSLSQNILQDGIIRSVAESIPTISALRELAGQD